MYFVAVLAVAVLAVQAAGALPDADGLLSYASFERGDGFDETGGGSDIGARRAAAETDGQVGSAAAAAGMTNPNADGQFDLGRWRTLQFWTRPKRCGRDPVPLIGTGTGDGSWEIRANPADATLEMHGALPYGGTIVAPVASGVVCDGTWMHVVVVRDAEDAVGLWIDGNLAAEPVAMCFDPATLPPGSLLRTGGEGDIDEIALWERPLSSTEIASLHARGSGRPLEILTVPGDGTGGCEQFDGLPGGAVAAVRVSSGTFVSLCWDCLDNQP